MLAATRLDEHGAASRGQVRSLRQGYSPPATHSPFLAPHLPPQAAPQAARAATARRLTMLGSTRP